MGNNNEIRQRMETYRKVLLAVVWIGAIVGIIGGIIMISYDSGYYSSNYPLRPYGIALFIASIIGGIIGHFLVNVGLAIPFILLNNGDYLAAIVPEGKTIKSAVSSETSDKSNLLKEGDTLVVKREITLKDKAETDGKETIHLNRNDLVKYIASVNNTGIYPWYLVETETGERGYYVSLDFEKVKNN